MRKILLTLILIGSAVTVFAQQADPGKFDIGIEGGIPLGSARSVSTFTAGGALQYSFATMGKTSFSISAGYTYFPYRGDVTVNYAGYVQTNSGQGYIPLKVGAKYFISDLFYAEGQVGASISTASGGSTAFAYAPGVGYQFDTHASIGVRFEGWVQSNYSTNQAVLRLAYSF